MVTGERGDRSYEDVVTGDGANLVAGQSKTREGGLPSRSTHGRLGFARRWESFAEGSEAKGFSWREKNENGRGGDKPTSPNDPTSIFEVNFIFKFSIIIYF